MRLLDETATLDLHAYLERINSSDQVDLDGPEPSASLLFALHQAHMLAVPFEDLSIHYGQPIILEEAALYDKIVRRRRFCFWRVCSL